MEDEWTRTNTSAAPDFLKKYYKSSRLHYLSTWKAELKEIMAKLQKPESDMTAVSSHRIIMHADFDSFFASVGILSRPYLKDQPVAVSHSQGSGSSSSSAVASCNYVARKYGIRNGMRVGEARKLCPQLIIVPYEFEKYKETSMKFYQILTNYADKIQAVSVDEALLDISSRVVKPWQGEEEIIAKTIRDEIRENTGCEVSIGVGRNILLAKMATKRAKPCGQFVIKDANVLQFLADKKVEDLPGVGWALSRKLREQKILKLEDLIKISRQTLQKDYGEKTGTMLYNFCRGIDERPLEIDKPRQSVSVHVSWGVRFETQEQADNFVRQLADEVSKRLQSVESKTKSITLVLKKKSKNASKPYMHLGHGECDNFAKSVTLQKCIDGAAVIAEQCLTMLHQFGFEPTDIRGIGIQTKIEDNENTINSNPKRSGDISDNFIRHKRSRREDGQLSIDCMFPFAKDDNIASKAVVKEGERFNIEESDVTEIEGDQDWDSKVLRTLQKGKEYIRDSKPESSYPRNQTVTQQQLVFKPPKSKPSLHGKSELNDVRAALTHWTTEFSDQPEPKDLMTVQTYVTALVKDKYIEEAQLILLHLTDLTEKLGNAWKEGVKLIKREVIEIVRKEYGGYFTI